MSADDTLLAEAERLGCSVAMVDDRPIQKDVRVAVLITQAHAFADAINREAGASMATVDRKHKHMLGGPVWVRIGSRAYEVPELRTLLRQEGHVPRFARRILADNGLARSPSSLGRHVRAED